MTRAAATVLALLPLVAGTSTGCRQILGIDSPTVIGDGGPLGDTPGDAPTVVTGTIVGAVITLDAAGNPIETDTPFAAGDLALGVRIGSGSSIALAVDSGGHFAFDRPDAATAYQLTATEPNDASVPPHSFDSTAASVSIGIASLGRAARTPVTGTQPIEYTGVTHGSAAVADELYTVGLWSTQTVSTRVGSAAESIDYALSTSASGALGEQAASQGDSTYLLELSAVSDGGGPSYHAVTGFRHDRLTTSPGQIVEVAGDFADAPRDTCFGLTAPQADEFTRISGSLPPDAARISAAWLVEAVPEPAVTLAGAAELASNVQSAAVDQMQDVSVAQVVTGHTLVVESEVLGMYTRQPGTSAGSTAFVAGTQLVDLVGSAAPDCGRAITLRGTVPVITDLVLAGMPVGAGATDVTIDPSSPVALAWQTGAGTTTADRYEIELNELTDAGGSTVSALITTTQPHTLLDPALFVPGHTYVISARAIVGAPGTSSGDFRSLAYPFQISFTVSGTITVN